MRVGAQSIDVVQAHGKTFEITSEVTALDPDRAWPRATPNAIGSVVICRSASAASSIGRSRSSSVVVHRCTVPCSLAASMRTSVGSRDGRNGSTRPP
jgi:hypothetical protein